MIGKSKIKIKPNSNENVKLEVPYQMPKSNALTHKYNGNNCHISDFIQVFYTLNSYLPL